jgi:hypothetical protein
LYYIIFYHIISYICQSKCGVETRLRTENTAKDSLFTYKVNSFRYTLTSRLMIWMPFLSNTTSYRRREESAAAALQEHEMSLSEEFLSYWPNFVFAIKFSSSDLSPFHNKPFHSIYLSITLCLFEIRTHNSYKTVEFLYVWNSPVWPQAEIVPSGLKQ